MPSPANPLHLDVMADDALSSIASTSDKTPYVTRGPPSSPTCKLSLAGVNRSVDNNGNPRGPSQACLHLSAPALPACGAALDRHLYDAVSAALVNQEAAVARRTHVADDAGIDATRGNRPALERFGLGIKPHQCIRSHARLVVPDDAVHDDDRIGMRLWPTRRRPLLDLAGLRIVATESAHP